MYAARNRIRIPKLKTTAWPGIAGTSRSMMHCRKRADGIVETAAAVGYSLTAAWTVEGAAQMASGWSVSTLHFGSFF